MIIFFVLSVDGAAEEEEPPINEGIGYENSEEVASPVGERSLNDTTDNGNDLKATELVNKLMTKLKDLNKFLEELIDEFDDHDHKSPVIDKGFNDPLVVDDPMKPIDLASPRPESEGSESELDLDRRKTKRPPTRRTTRRTTRRPTEPEDTSESILDGISEAVPDLISEVVSDVIHEVTSEANPVDISEVIPEEVPVHPDINGAGANRGRGRPTGRPTRRPRPPIRPPRGNDNKG